MTDVVGIADFICDDQLLGPWFFGPSWTNWMTVLKGAFGEELTADERAKFVELAEREPPKQRVRELWCAVGRRGGKDSIASAVATYCAVVYNYVPHLRPGERATIVCLAVDRDQARIVHSYIKAYFEICPMLAELVENVTANVLQLRNGVEIIIATSSYRGLRGKTYALIILDEVAFFREEGGSYVSPDTEIYSSLLPGLHTLRKAGAMIIGISSVHKKSGLLFQKWRDCHGQDGDILVIKQPSVVFNPLLDQAAIDADIALDPARGQAEWLSEWRTDVDDYVDRAAIEACVIPNRHELLPLRQEHRYIGFCDAAGGSGGDSYTAAVAHYEQRPGSKGLGVLDAVREIRPKFSPEVATAEHAAFFKSYGINSIIGDRYAGDWPADQFMRHGVTYTPSKRSKSEIYIETLPHLNAHAVELLDHQKLIQQFCSLERKVVRGSGREIVDHATGRRDDLANAASGALIEAIEAGMHRFVVTDEMIARARTYKSPVRLLGHVA